MNLRIQILPGLRSYGLGPADAASFHLRQYQRVRIHGPMGLVRLIPKAGVAAEGQEFGDGSPFGGFWFLQSAFENLRVQSAAAVVATGSEATEDRLALAFRIALRDALAVRRDWSPRFDEYALLQIPQGKSMDAWGGTIASQPVYDPSSEAGRTATAAGIHFVGGLDQFILSLNQPATRDQRLWIQGPFPL